MTSYRFPTRRSEVKDEIRKKYIGEQNSLEDAQKAAHAGASESLVNPATTAATLRNIGFFYYFESEYYKSILALEKALALDDTVGLYHRDLAHALYVKREFGRAATYFQRALDLDLENLQFLTWRTHLASSRL